MRSRGRQMMALLAVACAVMILPACGTSSSSASDTGTGYVAGDGSAVILSDAERKPAPALSGETLDGGQWSLADHAGEVVVANVWASWCAPCRAEAPTLEQVSQQRLADGVQFVGINVRDTDASAQAFVVRYGITYPNLVDSNGSLQLAFRDTLPPQAIPSTVFIDRQGRVAARVLGEIDEVRLNGILDTLVQEPA